MKKTEIIIAVLSLVSYGLALRLITGGIFLTTVTLLLLSLLYLCFGFALLNGISFRTIFKKASYKNTTFLRLIGSVIASYALSFGIIGILFGLLHWYGAGIILVTSIIQLAILGILALVKHMLNPSRLYVNTLKRVAIIGCITLILLFNSLKFHWW